MQEKKSYVFDAPAPNELAPTPKAPYNVCLKHVYDSIEITSLILANMILVF